MMDELDKRLVEELQKGIPIESRPFKKVGEVLGLEEKEVLERIKRLKEQGIIRRFGGVFNSRKMGYKGVLCAAKVPDEKLDDFVRIVNSYPEVTHNYERKATYNVWFTITAESEERIKKIVDDIEKKTGVAVKLLPAIKVYKLRVVFPMS